MLVVMIGYENINEFERKDVGYRVLLLLDLLLLDLLLVLVVGMDRSNLLLLLLLLLILDLLLLLDDLLLEMDCLVLIERGCWCVFADSAGGYRSAVGDVCASSDLMDWFVLFINSF
jgi:hypothetical protein